MRFSAVPESRKRPNAQGGQPSFQAPQAHVKADGHRGKPSMTQAKRLEKHHAINTAKKVAAKGNPDLRQVPVKSCHPFVFVGNLKSSIKIQRLHEMFEACGDIIEIVIRCSRGNAVTAGDPSESELSSLPERWYASVAFKRLPAAQKALSLNGKEVIDGRRIVVCKTAAELPEVHDFARVWFGQNQEKKGIPNQYRRKTRGLVPEPTEVDNPNDRHRAFGVSFAKCVF